MQIIWLRIFFSVKDFSVLQLALPPRCYCHCCCMLCALRRVPCVASLMNGSQSHTRACLPMFCQWSFRIIAGATCLNLALSLSPPLSLTLSFLSAFSSYFVAHFYGLLLLHRIMKWILHDIDSPAGSSSFWPPPPPLSAPACCTVAFLITRSLAGAWACRRGCLRLSWAHRINRKWLAA